jgi:hypothetical protein
MKTDGDSEVANASFSPSLIFQQKIIGTFDQAKERENLLNILLYAYSFSCTIPTYWSSTILSIQWIEGGTKTKPHKTKKGMKKQSAQYKVSSRRHTSHSRLKNRVVWFEPALLQLQHMSSLTTSPKAIVQMVRYYESSDSGIGKMAIHNW